MTHIASNPSAKNSVALAQWNNALVGPLSRLLALGHPQMLGWGTIDNALTRGAWTPTREDLSENALLGLLINLHLKWEDPIGNPYHPGLVVPMHDEMEALCLTLVGLGCSPRRAPEALGGLTALDLAVMHNAPRLVRDHADRAWHESRTIDGLPWLHAAALGGCVEVLEVLLNQGVDPNLRDAAGRTALFHASHFKTVEMLRARGADPTCLDQDNLDAVSFWRTHRPATQERIEELRRGLGKVKVEKGPAAVQQFLAMAATNSPTQIRKEQKRLKIVGNEWLNGQNIVSAYLTCLRKELNSMSSSRPTARRMEQIIGWDEAMGEATPAQVGQLVACAVLDGLDDSARTLQAKLPADQKDAIMREAWMEVLEGVQVQQARSHRIAHHILDSDLSLASKAAVLVKALANPSFPSTELLVQMAQLPTPAADPGWATPGFTTLMLRLCSCALSINPTPNTPSIAERAQLALRQSVLDRAAAGVAFAEALDAFPAHKDPRVGEFIDQLRALEDSLQLQGATPGASPSSRSMRL